MVQYVKPKISLFNTPLETTKWGGVDENPLMRVAMVNQSLETSDSETNSSFMYLLDRMMENIVVRDGYRISLWANFFSDPVFSTIERDHGLLRDEFNILACLVTYGSLAASDVCMVTGRPRNSVGRGVDRLWQKSMISRRSDKADRRRIILSVKPKGREAYEAIEPLFIQREQLMLAALDQNDRKALSGILDKLMASHHTWMNEF